MKKFPRALSTARVAVRGRSLAPRPLASVSGGGLTVGGGFGQVVDDVDGGSIGGSTGALELLGTGMGGAGFGRLP